MLVAAVKLRNSIPMILNHESERIYLHQLTRRARDAFKGDLPTNVNLLGRGAISRLEFYTMFNIHISYQASRNKSTG